MIRREIKNIKKIGNDPMLRYKFLTLHEAYNIKTERFQIAKFGCTFYVKILCFGKFVKELKDKLVEQLKSNI
jgi:hypothetical protein